MTAIRQRLIKGFAFAEKAACEARARYEFGCKFSIATTLDDGFIVGTRGFPGIVRFEQPAQTSVTGLCAGSVAQSADRIAAMMMTKEP